MISVVLVGPKYQGNIGSVARVMKNFGFRELVLVGAEVEKEAELMAVHAKDVLKKAKRYGAFAEVRKDFDFLVGTSGIRTSRDDHFHRLGISSREMGGRLPEGGKVGIVFGPEDVGLTNDETAACDLLVQVPTSDEYPIMNLSHAVGVVLYELSGKTLPRFRVASNKELEVLDGEMEKALGGWKKRDVVKLIFKRIFGRAVLSGREVNTLIGFFRKVERKSIKD